MSRKEGSFKIDHGDDLFEKGQATPIGDESPGGGHCHASAIAEPRPCLHGTRVRYW
jgi:hypothetical protein